MTAVQVDVGGLIPVNAYDRLVKQDSQVDYPEAHFNLALAQEKAGFWQQAMVSYRRFVEKMPNHSMVGHLLEHLPSLSLKSGYWSFPRL